jgi:hypothetical protein
MEPLQYWGGFCVFLKWGIEGYSLKLNYVPILRIFQDIRLYLLEHYLIARGDLGVNVSYW